MTKQEQSTFLNLLPSNPPPNGEMLNRDKVTCKFIIIRYQAVNHLVIGQVSDYPYHANLASQFCDRFGIPSAWQKKPDLLEIFDNGTTIQGGAGWKLIIAPPPSRFMADQQPTENMPLMSWMSFFHQFNFSRISRSFLRPGGSILHLPHFVIKISSYLSSQPVFLSK